MTPAGCRAVAIVVCSRAPMEGCKDHRAKCEVVRWSLATCARVRVASRCGADRRRQPCEGRRCDGVSRVARLPSAQQLVALHSRHARDAQTG